MIRQAHTYLVGALSGVVVIAIAIGAFVVLVSAQVFHDLPIPALSSSDQKAAVASGKAISSPGNQAVASTGGVSAATGRPTNPGGKGPGQTGATRQATGHRHQGNGAAPNHDATSPSQVVETSPSTGGGNTSPSTGGHSGSNSKQPSSSSSPPSSSSSPSSGGGGGGSNSSSGTSGSGNSATGTSSSGGSTGSGGGSTTTSPLPGTPVTTAKPSEVVTETVNNTVGGVDEALGGTLGETGVTHVTEEAVNGVAGPESVVGKTVDGVGEVVGGLLGGTGE